jgi:thiamine-phosphate diphosphorylase
MNLKGYYFITDPHYSQKGVLIDIQTALDCGVRIIQYRDKNKSVRQKLIIATAASELCHSYKAILIVNDSVELAWAVSADGVNVGQNDLPPDLAGRMLGDDKIIGVSVSTPDEARWVVQHASYLGIGPVFATRTKADAATPMGLELIKQIRAVTPLPIAAIGGIDFTNVRDVLLAGADMVCSIAAVYHAETLDKGIKEMVKICNEVKK